MRYEGRIYRPPSEANSLIVQATIGCSHNKCTFCNMYKDKQFKIRKADDILTDIKDGRERFRNINRIFIADGDALIMKTDELITILNYIKFTIPECERIGVYASPKSIMSKTPNELKLLKSKGIDIAYLGLESGSDCILGDIKKGSDSKEIIECGKALKDSGMLLSMTLISGIGGRKNWREHAIESAKAINEINPNYLSLLTLMIVEDTQLDYDIKNGDFIPLSPEEIIEETILLLEELNSEDTVFRSNHSSNYYSLKGTLNKDGIKMIEELRSSIKYIKG